MCCRKAQADARARMTAAEQTMREHGLYQVRDDDRRTKRWEEAQEQFQRALADHERLCAGCCR